MRGAGSRAVSAASAGKGRACRPARVPPGRCVTLARPAPSLGAGARGPRRPLPAPRSVLLARAEGGCGFSSRGAAVPPALGTLPPTPWRWAPRPWAPLRTQRAAGERAAQRPSPKRHCCFSRGSPGLVSNSGTYICVSSEPRGRAVGSGRGCAWCGARAARCPRLLDYLAYNRPPQGDREEWQCDLRVQALCAASGTVPWDAGKWPRRSPRPLTGHSPL